jgi:hypothetical protein
MMRMYPDRFELGVEVKLVMIRIESLFQRLVALILRVF